MLTRLLTTALVLTAATAAGAQTLSPALQPGLWETDPTMLINGRDIMATMRQMQEQIMANLPPEHRKRMTDMMSKQGMQMVGGKVQQCLSKADTDRARDPKSALAEMRRNAPKCSLGDPSVSGSTLSFKGRCDDPNGFTGDITGEYVIDSATAWHGSFKGKGSMPQMSKMPGMTSPDGTVLMQLDTRARWIGADCGTVKPVSATR